jgi:hypothetical protein
MGTVPLFGWAFWGVDLGDYLPLKANNCWDNNHARRKNGTGMARPGSLSRDVFNQRKQIDR